MKDYKVIIYKEGLLITDKPLQLSFKSALHGVMQIMKEYSENLTKSITIKMDLA